MSEQEGTDLHSEDTTSSVAIEIVEVESVTQSTVSIAEPKPGWKRYRGIILTLISSVFYSLSMLVVKIMDDYHPLNKTVWRYFGILLPAIPIALYYDCVKKAKIFNAVWPLREREKIINFFGTHIRGVILFGMILLSFWALRYLTVADLSVISYSGPVFVMILSFLLLDEKCGIVPILVTILTFAGVLIILRPPLVTGESSFSVETVHGVCLGVASMICYAFLVTLLRRTRKVHFTYMLLVSGVWGVAESLVAAIAFGELKFPSTWEEILLAYIAIPVLAFISQITIVLALKFESGSIVSLIRSCDVVFAFIWQAVFLHQSPDGYSIMGAAVIITGVVILSIRTWLLSLPVNDSTRNKYRFLLR